MDDLNNDLYVSLLVVIQLTTMLILLKKERASRRRWAVRPINQKRNEHGEFATLFQEIKKDEFYFFKYTRMNLKCFNYLLKKVTPYLLKRSQREPLCPEQRLAMTLKYLSSGSDIFSIASSFRIGESTLRAVIKETCIALIKVLAPEYLSLPTAEKWREISKGFEDVWNLPNCGGAIDGKHIHIRAPANSGTLFFNYKKTFSIVLMAVCDFEYKFSLVDIGAFGSSNDAGIFHESQISEGLFNGSLNFHKESFPIKNSDLRTPIYLVGDSIFPISTRLMKPYAGSFLGDKKNIFNYRLSRARRIVENAFGILSSRWRILYTNISADPERVENIVMVVICLHNFLMSLNNKTDAPSRRYCPPSFIDQETNDGHLILGDWRFNGEDQLREFPPRTCRQETAAGQSMRDKLATFFMSAVGAIPWQNDYIRRGQYADN